MDNFAVIDTEDRFEGKIRLWSTHTDADAARTEEARVNASFKPEHRTFLAIRFVPLADAARVRGEADAGAPGHEDEDEPDTYYASADAKFGYPPFRP
jgi:hypothetical protein